MLSKIDRIEHMMHKGGKFVFSCNCDDLSILLLNKEAHTLYKALKKIPTFPTFFAEMEPSLIKRSIFGTAAIEGNPLTEQEAAKIVENPSSSYEGVVPNQAEQEIKNLTNAYELLKSKSAFFTNTPSAIEQSFTITEDFCKEIHAFMTKDIAYNGNIVGKYRNMMVNVGDSNHGGAYTPPRTLDDIKTLMSIFVKWINSDAVIAMGPFIRAALAHYYMALIHPFQDGNGRTARFLEASILRAADISFVPFVMSNYYYQNLDVYFSVFSSSRKQQDMTPFLEFFFKGVIESLENIERASLGSIQPVILKDFIQLSKKNKVLNQRQAELLEQLIDCKKPFTLGELFTAIPFRYLYQNVTESTARRDIKKLVEQKFLVEHDGKYSIHYAMLGNTVG